MLDAEQECVRLLSELENLLFQFEGVSDQDRLRVQRLCAELRICYFLLANPADPFQEDV